MNIKDFDALKSAVKLINEKYPRPGLKLILNEPTPVNTRGMWQNADKKGLYFLFDIDGKLQYLGRLLSVQV